MAANEGQVERGTRHSALWGTGGKRGDGSRSSALWGKGGRTALVLGALTCAAMLVPFGAAAGPGPKPKGSGASNVYVTDTLLQQAQANPHATFNVIVQGDGNKSADRVAQLVAHWAADASKQLGDASKKANDALAKAQRDVADATAKLAKAKPQGLAKAQANLATARAELVQAEAAQNDAQASISALAQNVLQQNVTSQFSSITGIAVTLTGDQITHLVDHADGLLSITPNAPTVSGDPTPAQTPTPPTGSGTGSSWSTTSSASDWFSTQVWPYESQVSAAWARDKGPGYNPSTMPSIAIVDSGIQAGRPDFGDRVIASTNLSTLPGNTAGGDQRGHGTFVAGIAADGLSGITGANPVAKLIDVKVLDSTGMGLTSDIINACQWILAHKDQYDIRVANFSLQSDITAPFYIDPLDRAVEQLWFNGIVVVTSAGNYGNPYSPSGVLYSPADDPFVITVGATDVHGSIDPKDATVAPWSAWGYTVDGFAKPELSAPGRYMVGPVPPDSALVAEKPANVVAPGYMQLSGTSFAAPVVSGAVATILDQHPNWTPDQVKGALMLTATGLSNLGGAGGVGTVRIGPIFGPGASNPPNPNLALEAFLKTTSSNGTSSVSFDGASWNSAVLANVSWNSVSWNSASWNSASWNSASWNSVSWNSVSWNSASWNSASWNSVSWDSASWNSASWNDGAVSDPSPAASAIWLGKADVAALLADPNVDPSTLPPDLLPPPAASGKTMTATGPTSGASSTSSTTTSSSSATTGPSGAAASATTSATGGTTTTTTVSPTSGATAGTEPATSGATTGATTTTGTSGAGTSMTGGSSPTSTTTTQ